MKKYCLLFAISLLLLSNYCVASENVKGLVGEADKIISAALASRDERIRANAVEVVSESRIERMKDIVPLLDDPSVLVRFASAVAVGDTKYVSAKPKIKLMTKDPDLNVNLAAAYSLYQLGDEKYLKFIEDRIFNDDQTVQANAAMLLGKIGSKHSLDVLYKLKDNPDSSNVAAFNATEAIAKIGDEKIYKKIWTMLISVYADDRYMGAHAMAALGGNKGTNALMTLLDDDVTEVKLTAAERLGFLGDNSGQAVVLEYFTSHEPVEKAVADRCNVLATLAIGQTGSDQLTVYLPKLLKNESPFVQIAAAKSVFLLEKR